MCNSASLAELIFPLPLADAQNATSPVPIALITVVPALSVKVAPTADSRSYLPPVPMRSLHALFAKAPVPFATFAHVKYSGAACAAPALTALTTSRVTTVVVIRTVRLIISPLPICCRSPVERHPRARDCGHQTTRPSPGALAISARRSPLALARGVYTSAHVGRRHSEELVCARVRGSDCMGGVRAAPQGVGGDRWPPPASCCWWMSTRYARWRSDAHAFAELFDELLPFFDSFFPEFFELCVVCFLCFFELHLRPCQRFPGGHACRVVDHAERRAVLLGASDFLDAFERAEADDFGLQRVFWFAFEGGRDLCVPLPANSVVPFFSADSSGLVIFPITEPVVLMKISAPQWKNALGVSSPPGPVKSTPASPSLIWPSSVFSAKVLISPSFAPAGSTLSHGMPVVSQSTNDDAVFVFERAGDLAGVRALLARDVADARRVQRRRLGLRRVGDPPSRLLLRTSLHRFRLAALHVLLV